jgi:hypothetical protein
VLKRYCDSDRLRAFVCLRRGNTSTCSLSYRRQQSRPGVKLCSLCIHLAWSGDSDRRGEATEMEDTIYLNLMSADTGRSEDRNIGNTCLE